MRHPKTWKVCPVEAIGDVVTGTTPSTKNPDFHGGDIPFVKPGDLDNEGPIVATTDTVTSLGAAEGRTLPTGTVLVSCIGNLGKVGLLARPGLANQQINAIVPHATIDSRFVYYWARTLKSWLQANSSATTIAIINKSRFAQAPFFLAPSNEQRRIVAKLDAIFEQTRAAKARLERLPALLEKLKRSILAAAFRGDLTKDWRAAHSDVEPAPTRSFDSEAKAGRLWGSGASAERPARELPARWRWARVRELGPNAVQIGPMSMKSNEFTGAGTTVLNVGCVQWGWLDISKCDFLPEKRAAEFERYRIRAGDVLFTRSGTVGRIAVATEEADGALITFHLLRIRSASDICRPGLLYLALRGAPEVRAAIDEVAVGATRAGFNTRLLEDLWIPLPPIAEQDEIAVRVNAALTAVDELGARILRAGGKANELENAALAKAFRGELVPQDPNDEPASVLLERIRASRATQPESPRRGRRPRREAPTPEHSAEPKPNGHTPAATHDESLDLVIAMFQQGKPRLTANDITKATGLQSAAVKKVLKQLVEGGQVRVQGRARGTTFEWTV